MDAEREHGTWEEEFVFHIFFPQLILIILSSNISGKAQVKSSKHLKIDRKTGILLNKWEFLVIYTLKHQNLSLMTCNFANTTFQGWP